MTDARLHEDSSWKLAEFPLLVLIEIVDVPLLRIERVKSLLPIPVPSSSHQLPFGCSYAAHSINRCRISSCIDWHAQGKCKPLRPRRNSASTLMGCMLNSLIALCDPMHAYCMQKQLSYDCKFIHDAVCSGEAVYMHSAHLASFWMLPMS